MMRCPLCTHASYTRTSRYITERTKEAYYQCQNLTCSCTFKTVESVDKILCQPIQAQPVDENALPLPEKRTLNRYRRYNNNQPCTNHTPHCCSRQHRGAFPFRLAQNSLFPG